MAIYRLLDREEPETPELRRHRQKLLEKAYGLWKLYEEERDKRLSPEHGAYVMENARQRRLES